MIPTGNDPYNLMRFVDAQDAIYQQVCTELRDGMKRSHWMWFIFPQIAGLGHSPIAQKFAIGSLDEAKAYMRHALLGARLIECTELVNRISARSIQEIFGSPDDMKFHSSVTLFARSTVQNHIFLQALHKYFADEFDPRTDALLQIP